MGQRSKAYTKSLLEAMKKADVDVNRCQQFMIGIDGSREGIEKALSVIEPKMKLAPTKTFAELAKTDPEVKKAGTSFERASKELDDYKEKFAKTVVEATFSVEQAQVIIKNFDAFCTEKSKTWNPFKKKSLSKSVAALKKASTDLENLRKFLAGMIDLQKQKGNFV
jgi:hypothetical protein